MFGVARLYAGAGLVADVLARHPGVRVELIGQNSTEVQEDLRRGRLEAAMIAMPQVTSEGMTVIPVARDEIVYISADPERLASPVTAKRLRRPPWSCRTPPGGPTTRSGILLRQMLHETGLNPQTRIEVEDLEIAVELVGHGARRLGGPQGRRRAAAPPAGAERGVGVAAAAGCTTCSRSCTGPAPPSPRPPADDRAGDQADPGHRRAGPRRLDGAGQQLRPSSGTVPSTR